MRDIDLYEQVVRHDDGVSLPSLDAWNPPFAGDIDILIRRDGVWFHEGKPIQRESLVRLFSSILCAEDGQYFLKTPVEKVRIKVEEAPFVVADVEFCGSGDLQDVFFKTLTGDRFLLDLKHPLTVKESLLGEPTPFVLVRRNLYALIQRKVFYRLVDAAKERPCLGGVEMFVRSAGADFVLGVWNE